MVVACMGDVETSWGTGGERSVGIPPHILKVSVSVTLLASHTVAAAGLALEQDPIFSRLLLQMRLLCLLLGVVGVAVCDPARWAGQQQRVRRQQQGGALPRPLPGNRPLRPARPGRPGRRGPAAQPPVQRRGPYRAEQQRVIRPFPQQQQARPQPQRSHQVGGGNNYLD